MDRDAARPPPRRALAVAVRVGVLALVGVLAWLFVRDLDGAALRRAIASARLPLLVPAVAIAFAMLWCAAIGLRVLLAPAYAVATRRLFRYTIVAYAGSILAPLRAGEALRVWLLKQRDGVPVADSAAAVVAQKLVDGVTMLVVVAPLPLLVPGVPAWVGELLLVGAAIAVAIFGALLATLGYIDRRLARTPTARTWLVRFIAGMHAVRHPRRLALVGAAHAVAWLLDLVMVTCVLRAVGIELPIAAGLLVLFTLNVALVIPTPGNLGTLEAGALVATRLFGIDDERALAFALLYHACLVVPILVAGCALELPILLGRAAPSQEA